MKRSLTVMVCAEVEINEETFFEAFDRDVKTSFFPANTPDEKLHQTVIEIVSETIGTSRVFSSIGYANSTDLGLRFELQSIGVDIQQAREAA
ncbi:putative auxin conjugate hydrolase [Roseibium sp. TrichSKD4]|uniref:hypothetical protein n=1 Tax=Roseibium sp. TrichSKD4 TaxID=744980 RepID=UPI0001E56D36|nr:hypothetical protein [Roseibium sp. TrichSKD4]EFO33247.1 putative auxin conjugate hydrolase [Roseibium sp. TrichSKD4]